MTSRLLPREEWHRLKGTEAEDVCGSLPATASVLAVEHDDAIVGCWVLMPVLHAECLWIAPVYRGKTSVARRLWALMRRTVGNMGGGGVFTAAMSDDVRALLAHVGAEKLPGDHYVLTFKESV